MFTVDSQPFINLNFPFSLSILQQYGASFSYFSVVESIALISLIHISLVSFSVACAELTTKDVTAVRFSGKDKSNTTLVHVLADNAGTTG